MIYKPDTVCVLCLTDKEDGWQECAYWVDEHYEHTGGQHQWNVEDFEIPNFSFVEIGITTTSQPAETNSITFGGNIKKDLPPSSL